MDKNGRILYLNHDSQIPAGGVRTIYYHVHHLVKNGYSAFVVHNQKDFRPSWFETDVPILYMQNDFRIFPNDIPVIHNGIPLDVFKPGRKKLQIAYMPRKRPLELDFIRNLFNRLYGQYKQVPWVCIDKMDETEVAKVLGESAIYLSTSLYEGFGLPPLEAMACGCIVVGFHGYGGLEYATDYNGFWCEEGNLIECAKRLGHVVSLIDDDNETIHEVKEEALKTAGEYSFDRHERELIAFWKKVFE